MKIKHNIQIDAPAEKVWDILWNKFGDVCDWASTVNESSNRYIAESTHGGRTCISTWGEISEVIDSVNENRMTYTYHADGLPSMMKSVVNTFTVNKKNVNTSELAVDINIEIATLPRILMGWMIVPKMKKDIFQTLEDLKYFIETGKQTEAKIKSDRKFLKKHPEKYQV